jgi:hypothetical protein
LGVYTNLGMSIGFGSLHEFGNDNGVTTVYFATSKNMTVKSYEFPYRNTHKFIRTFLDGNAIKYSIF